MGARIQPCHLNRGEEARRKVSVHCESLDSAQTGPGSENRSENNIINGLFPSPLFISSRLSNEVNLFLWDDINMII